MVARVQGLIPFILRCGVILGRPGSGYFSVYPKVGGNSRSVGSEALSVYPKVRGNSGLLYSGAVQPIRPGRRPIGGIHHCCSETTNLGHRKTHGGLS